MPRGCAGLTAVAGGLATVAPDNPGPRSFSTLWAPLAFVTAPIVALDQWSKIYVRSHFHLYQSRPLVAGWLDLTYTLNPGAAFSLFATTPPVFRSIFFIALSFVATVVLIFLMARRATTMTYSIAYAMILAGTIGNLIDRAARGLVTDFIYFHHASFSYPVFNLADSAITAGVALILILSWLEGRRAAPSSPSA